MSKHVSSLSVGGTVQFPEWRGERHYMVPFTASVGPLGEVARFAVAVRQMLAGLSLDPNQECYLMVDERTVEPGAFHRRPGLHVDGYWHPTLQCHGGGGSGGHGYSPPSPTPRPAPAPRRPRPAPAPKAPGEPVVPSTPPDYWRETAPARGEALILASSYSSARGLVGTYERDFASDWRGGDCSTIKGDGLDAVALASHTAYHMSVFTLHESLPVRERVRRTLIRLNVPGGAAL
jgi:hypothetical protein